MRVLARLSHLALIALTACTASGGGTAGGDAWTTADTLPPPASGPPVQLVQYCDAYVQLACDTAASCRCFDVLGGDTALCQGFMRQRCASEVTDRVAEGAVTFDPARAGQCLAAIRAIVADCAIGDGDVLLYVASHCDDFLVGARTAGQPCEDSDDCRPPLACRDDQCVVLPGPGAACRDGECADGAYCGDDDTCRAHAPRGAACDGEDWACGEDLYCDSRTDTCEPYLAAGQPCGHDTWACGDDLRCTDDTAVCAPYPGAGQPCADEACRDGLYCDATSTCQALRGDGSTCSDDEECASDTCDDGACAPATSDVCGAL